MAERCWQTLSDQLSFLIDILKEQHACRLPLGHLGPHHCSQCEADWDPAGDHPPLIINESRGLHL